MVKTCIRHPDRHGKVLAHTVDYPPNPPEDVRLCEECFSELRGENGEHEGEIVRIEDEHS